MGDRRMATVSVVIPCRDGEPTLPDTLESLLDQDIGKIHIAVGNDASIDCTHWILEHYGIPYVTYPKRMPKNYSRVPILLNMATELVPDSDYYMVSGDDMTYSIGYIRQVIEHMEAEGVSIASGYSIEYGYKSRSNAPGGSGRIYTKEAWALATPFYPTIAWETGALYKVLMHGGKLGFYPIAKSHTRPQGMGSTWTFGHGAYVLGTPLLFTFLRVIKCIIKKEHPPLNGVSILMGQLEYMIRRPPKADIASYVSDMKKRQLMKSVKSIIYHLFTRPARRMKARYVKTI